MAVLDSRSALKPRLPPRKVMSNEMRGMIEAPSAAHTTFLRTGVELECDESAESGPR